MVYIDVSGRNYMLADVEAPWPTPNTCGHEVADRLVGRSIHDRRS